MNEDPATFFDRSVRSKRGTSQGAKSVGTYQRPAEDIHSHLDTLAEQWKQSDQFDDPVHSSDHIRATVEKDLGFQIQPFYHSPVDYFPTVAKGFGLERFIPDGFSGVSKSTKGPRCTVAGVSGGLCHFNCLPSFLYSLPDDITCPSADKADAPTLAWHWAIIKTVDGDGTGLQLKCNTCWYCWTRTVTRCALIGRRYNPVKDSVHLKFGKLPVEHSEASPLSEAPVLPQDSDTEGDQQTFDNETHQEDHAIETGGIEEPTVDMKQAFAPANGPISSQVAIPEKELKRKLETSVAVGSPHPRKLAKPIDLRPLLLKPDPSAGLQRGRDYIRSMRERSRSKTNDQSTALEIPALGTTSSAHPPPVPAIPEKYLAPDPIPLPVTPNPASSKNLEPLLESPLKGRTATGVQGSAVFATAKTSITGHFAEMVKEGRDRLFTLQQHERAVATILDNLFVSYQRLEVQATTDHEAVESIRAERDKATATMRGMDRVLAAAKQASESQKLLVDERDLTIKSLSDQVVFLETAVENSKKDQAVIEERHSNAVNEVENATQERDEYRLALEQSNLQVELAAKAQKDAEDALVETVREFDDMTARHTREIEAMNESHRVSLHHNNTVDPNDLQGHFSADPQVQTDTSEGQTQASLIQFTPAPPRVQRTPGAFPGHDDFFGSAAV